MLPPDPPKLSSRDFDPATMADDVNMELEVDEDESRVELSSVEINILIYLYLLESNFSHTAFTLLSESNLPTTSLFKHYNPSFPTPTAPNSKGKQSNGSSAPSRQSDGFGRSEGRIERGELVRRLWKSLRWEEVERHIGANGEPFKPTCPNPFHLLIPHACPPSFPSSSNNPTLPLPPSLRVSPPPPKRPEVFPPGPEAPEAGPSRTNRSTGQAINISTTSQAETSTVDPVKGKRKSRRESDASDSREASPAASTRAKSPVPTTKSKKRDKDKKRARISDTATAMASDLEKEDQGKGRAERDNDDEDDMNVDDEPKESRRSKAKSGPNGKADSSKLTVEEKPDRRSKSPMKSTPRLKGRIPDTESEQDEPEKPSRNGRKSTSAQEKKVETPAHIISEDHVATFVEHRDMVSCVAWNPQNRLNLSTGSSDGTARLWDFDEKDEGSALSLLRQTPIPHKSIESSKKGVTALAWHPDGTFFATGCQDGVGRLFTPSGSMQGIMSYGRGAISALKFSPSGSFILTAKDDFTICLWSIGNVYQRPMLRSFESHKGKVTDIDWLDDDVFASGGHDHTVFIFRTNDKRPRYTFKGHTDDVTKLKWSPTASTINKLGGASKEWEKRLLASVSDDGTCMVWKLPSYPEDRGTTSRSSSPTKISNAGAIANGPGGSEKDDYFQGNGAVIGIDHCVNRLNVVTRSVNRRMDTLEWSPSCKDGRMILAAGGQDSTVKLFDALSGQTLYTLSGLETGTGSICFSPAAKNLVAGGGWNGKLVIWDIETGKRVKELEIEEDAGKQASREKPMMMTMQWRDDGEHLAIGMHNKSLMTVYTGDLGKRE